MAGTFKVIFDGEWARVEDGNVIFQDEHGNVIRMEIQKYIERFGSTRLHPNHRPQSLSTPLSLSSIQVDPTQYPDSETEDDPSSRPGAAHLKFDWGSRVDGTDMDATEMLIQIVFSPEIFKRVTDKVTSKKKVFDEVADIMESRGFKLPWLKTHGIKDTPGHKVHEKYRNLVMIYKKYVLKLNQTGAAPVKAPKYVELLHPHLSKRHDVRPRHIVDSLSPSPILSPRQPTTFSSSPSPFSPPIPPSPISPPFSSSPISAPPFSSSPISAPPFSSSPFSSSPISPPIPPSPISPPFSSSPISLLLSLHLLSLLLLSLHLLLFISYLSSSFLSISSPSQ
ncbi:hypothetical protein WDU94_010777 [Cyamophila willieti]